MIPLFYEQSDTVQESRPSKNPIYFIRKSLGRLPQSEASIIVLNSENRTDSYPLGSIFLPSGYDYRETEWVEGAWYDVEVFSQQTLWDANVEPNADRDGSIASEPRSVQRLITLNGFIRATNSKSLSEAIYALNYAFDPVINFLEGSSTFDHTLAPNSQPFNNVGFGVLAWYDNRFVTAPEAEPYKNLNRFAYVRSLSHPVPMVTKFDDFNARFNIQLLAIDPRSYEFIGPTSFGQTIQTSNGEDLTPDNSAAPTVESTESIVQPSRIWAGTDMASPFGPGYREETMVIDNSVGIRWHYKTINGDFYENYGDTATTPGPNIQGGSTRWLTDMGGGIGRTPGNISPPLAYRADWDYTTGGNPVGGGKVRVVGTVQHPNIISEPAGTYRFLRELDLVFMGVSGVIETHILAQVDSGETASFDKIIDIPAATTSINLNCPHASGADANASIDISAFKMLTADPGEGNPQLVPSIIIDNTDATYPSWPLIWLELEGDMQAFLDPDLPPDIYREESPNFARHIKLANPIELDPEASSGAPVKVMIDTFNRQMYVDPSNAHEDQGDLLHYLSADSRFFYLLPGKINWITFSNFPDGMLVGIRWRKAYV